jgi:exosome complex component RRP40
MATRVVFPGEELVDELAAVSTDLRLGDGLVAAATGDSIRATKPGWLCHKKPNRFFIQTASRRYIPAVGDVVVGIIADRNAEFYRVQLHGTSLAILPALAFDGATKRNKPNLAVGAVVFARVAKCCRHMEPELSCEGKNATHPRPVLLLQCREGWTALLHNPTCSWWFRPKKRLDDGREHLRRTDRRHVIDC